MASFYTSSPTVVIPPQPHPDQYFHAAGHYQPFQPSAMLPNGLFNQSPSSVATPPTPSYGCIAGRKRSRGDIEDDIEEPSATAPIEPPLALNREPIYGPGMTLSYPNDPRGHYASEPEEPAELGSAKDRSIIMPCRKSQRTTAHCSDQKSPQSQPDQSIRALSDESFIDEVTRMLGISWMRMDRYEGGRINQRAYTRWIECHYPGLTNVDLWFENSSIPGYLGTAMNKAADAREYLLWSFDLKQAVLVTGQSSELISKLGIAQPSTLIKSATTTIFANDQPTFEDGSTPPPEAQASTLPTSHGGDMEVDA